MWRGIRGRTCSGRVDCRRPMRICLAMGQGQRHSVIATHPGSFHLEVDWKRRIHSILDVPSILHWHDIAGGCQGCLESVGSAQGEILLLARVTRSLVDSRTPETPWIAARGHLHSVSSTRRNHQPPAGVVHLHARDLAPPVGESRYAALGARPWIVLVRLVAADTIGRP